MREDDEPETLETNKTVVLRAVGSHWRVITTEEDTIRFALYQPHVDSAKDGLERRGKKGGRKAGGALLGFQHGQIKGSRQIQKSLKE